MYMYNYFVVSIFQVEVFDIDVCYIVILKNGDYMIGDIFDLVD